MNNAIIIHGAYGNPNENWFPWLKGELEKNNYKVFVPAFPTPENQSLENWMNVFTEYDGKLNSETIMIGHSIGVGFILNVLEKYNQKIKACYLVSGFIGLLSDKTLNEINKIFVEKEFDWKKIKNNCENFVIFHSENDPYVPIDKAYELAALLEADLIIVKDGGHFNKVAGYEKFELLLREII